MKCYVGHYMGDENSWFLIAAPSVERAIAFIDGEWGEPDARSMKEAKNVVAVNFYAKIADDCLGPYAAAWCDDRTRLGNHDDIGLGGCGDRADSEDWVTLRLLRPLEASGSECGAMEAILGRPMPALMRRTLSRTREIRRFRREMARTKAGERWQICGPRSTEEDVESATTEQPRGGIDVRKSPPP